MVIYVDIDETICFRSKEHGLDYTKSQPHKESINKINDLYDKGHKIIYWTARGKTTGIDWSELTKQQLNNWGVKHHKLILDKPYYDIFIDNRNFRAEGDWINKLDNYID